MPDYRTMYYKLMGKVADAVELLIEAQREGERAVMEDDQEVVLFIERTEDNESE